jgi:putative tributyrin esterase
MPQVHRSFYANEAYGMRFWDFLPVDLPAIVERSFRVSARREDTFVAEAEAAGVPLDAGFGPGEHDWAY